MFKNLDIHETEKYLFDFSLLKATSLEVIEKGQYFYFWINLDFRLLLDEP